MDRRGLSDLVRASVHHYNISDAIERFLSEWTSIISV